MTTAHVLERLPLWVEGDLSEGEASAVQAHLAQCPACRAAAEALRESQAWLKAASGSPFTFEERRQLRQDVMARIQAVPPRKLRGAPPFLKVRPILLAVAALGLFLILAVKGLPWGHADRQNRVAVQAPPPRPEPDPGLAPAPAVPDPRPRFVGLRSPAQTIKASAPSEAGLSRIEFKTRNPNIRIIWLARANAAPVEPHPSLDRATDPL